MNAPMRLEAARSEEHTSELQSRRDLVCRLLLEKKQRRQKDLDANRQMQEKYRCGRRPKSPAQARTARPPRRLLRAEALHDRVCFFNDTATTEIYTLSLHDALPIFPKRRAVPGAAVKAAELQQLAPLLPG